ncbi:MAG: hypothetical protein QXL94_06435 [Candidatus Parvarchaeum sp.]
METESINRIKLRDALENYTGEKVYSLGFEHGEYEIVFEGMHEREWGHKKLFAMQKILEAKYEDFCLKISQERAGQIMKEVSENANTN